MSFAEIVLRIGTAIGGWLIFIGYALTIAVLRKADCDLESDELWRGTLFFAALTAVALIFVGRGLRWSSTIRWFAVPGIGLAIYAAVGIFPSLNATSIHGASLCGITNSALSGAELMAIQATSLERFWPIAQCSVLLAGIVQGYRYWTYASGIDSTQQV